MCDDTVTTLLRLGHSTVYMSSTESLEQYRNLCVNIRSVASRLSALHYWSM
jgi:hypothetical protein